MDRQKWRRVLKSTNRAWCYRHKKLVLQTQEVGLFAQRQTEGQGDSGDGLRRKQAHVHLGRWERGSKQAALPPSPARGAKKPQERAREPVGVNLHGYGRWNLESWP